MAMKLVKKTDEYSIYLRGDKRYAVKDANKQPVNAEEKVRILVEAELLKVAIPVKTEEPEAEAAVAEDAEAVAEETAAEEPAAEEAPAEEAAGEETPAEDEDK